MHCASIRFKLIFGGILIVLIPMAVCGYVAITNSAKAITQLSKTNEQFIAEGTAMQVAATLDGEMKFTASFAARTQVKIAAEAVSARGITGAAEAVKAIRQDIKKRFELLNANYSAIFVTDVSGTLYAEAVEGGEDLKAWEIDKHPCFLEAKTTRKVVAGEIVRSKSTHEPTMVLCGPIFSDNGAFLGVVGTLLKASVITNLVTTRKIGETGYCFMINEQGLIIAHPDEKNVLKLDLKTVEGMGKISAAMMDGRSGAESYVFKGIDKVAGFVPVKGKNWSIAATQNAAEFLASVFSLRNSIGLIILIAIALTFVVIFLAAASITRPLQKVIDGLQDITRGRGQVVGAKRIAITSNDEIGTLSRKFNSLMESINDLSVFKKVIEEDTTLDEVYQRMGEVFTQKLGLSCCFIYQIINAKDEMFLTYPNTFDHAEMLCYPDILDDCGLCKAKRTGHIVTSKIFPKICRQFAPQDGRTHHCCPILVGGATVAVIQFVFDPPASESEELVNDARIFKAEEYISESLAVIETKRLMGSLRDSALIDGLTGLHNRRYLQEYAEKIVAGVLRRGKAIGLIMCDLDYFKQVNDTHGHNAGDIVLKEAAKVIRQSVREADLVIRFGGEEFLAVLLDISEGESLRVAEKIRHNIEKCVIKLPDGVIQKTISLGTSEFPADTSTLWSCIKYADVALYRAKNEGRNRCVRFTKDMWTEDQV
jgi:diguanylate cyclase (GGDEF)-like protein